MIDFTRHETQNKWICHLILHDGEGPRGQRVLVNFIQTISTAEEAAEAAAAQLNDEEGREQGYDCPCTFDRTSMVIEVETPRSVQRFRVYCTVKTEYRAQKEGPI